MIRLMLLGTDQKGAICCANHYRYEWYDQKINNFHMRPENFVLPHKTQRQGVTLTHTDRKSAICYANHYRTHSGPNSSKLDLDLQPFARAA